jgi:hypothetical protein
LLALLPAQTALRPQPGFPPQVERYLASAHVTADDRRRLLAGLPIARSLPADPSKELAVFGALWINGSIDRYVARLDDIERFEQGGRFKLTRRISAPPLLSDFSQLRVTDEDIRDLRSCRVDDCDVKLGEPAIQRFQTGIDWKNGNPRPQVDALMRQIAYEYVTAYLKGGNSQLPVYRDRSQPMAVAAEFRDMIDHMDELPLYAPGLRQYLVEYPAVTLPDATSFLYWQETEFGLKPIIRISHLTIRQSASGTVVASRMLYATHYFWTALELRALVPDPSRGNGFWLLTTSRSRTDGLSGLTGLFIRRRVRSEVVNGTLNVLRSTQQKMDEPEKRTR